MSREPRDRALAALSSFVISDATLRDTLTQIAEIVTDAVDPADFAGISLLGSDGRPTTAIYTDPESPEIDSAQYEAGEGPCLDSWRSSSVVTIGDTTTDRRYPPFCAAAAEHGIGSTVSLPLAAAAGTVGALNLYSHRRNGFAPRADLDLAAELIVVAANLVANTQSYWGAVELAEQLEAALESRATIDQAKGILMADAPGIGPEGAFELLRRASQRENVKLRDIARRIVEGRS